MSSCANSVHFHAWRVSSVLRSQLSNKIHVRCKTACCVQNDGITYAAVQTVRRIKSSPETALPIKRSHKWSIFLCFSWLCVQEIRNDSIFSWELRRLWVSEWDCQYALQEIMSAERMVECTLINKLFWFTHTSVINHMQWAHRSTVILPCVYVCDCKFDLCLQGVLWRADSCAL